MKTEQKQFEFTSVAYIVQSSHKPFATTVKEAMKRMASLGK